MTSSAFILSTCFSTHNFLSSVGNSYPLLCLDISTLKLHHFVAYIGHLLSSSSKDDFRCKMVIIITCLSCVSPTYRNSYLTKNDFVNLFVQILLRDSITRDRFPHFLKYSLSNWKICTFQDSCNIENIETKSALQHTGRVSGRQRRERGLESPLALGTWLRPLGQAGRRFPFVLVKTTWLLLIFAPLPV